VRVAILADERGATFVADLIWSSRLTDLVRAAGAEPRTVRSAAGLDAAVASVDAVIVDLTARGYDGLVAATSAVSAGRPTLAVGQHDDAEIRRRALDAGAAFVPYRRLADERGATFVADWLAATAAARVGTGT
jgi:DNA-binding NarL/FixJ family response regulator